MTGYVALLRAVNLGPTNKLPMAGLKRIAEEAGFAEVRTYIASGNVLFECGLKEKAIKAELEKRLEKFAGKPIEVFVRTAKEVAAIVRDFPFKNAAKNRSVVIFLDGEPPADTLERLSGQDDEKVALGKREIYVAYGANGIGRSKLKIAAASGGTARNLNTVETLADMAASR